MQNDVGHGVRQCNNVLMLENVTNTCERMQNSSTIAGFLQCNGGKFEDAEDIKCVFIFNCVLESK